MKRNKIKNFVFGTLLIVAALIAYVIGSSKEANATSTYIGGQTIQYEVVNVNGHYVAVFKYGNDIEVVRL